MRNVYPNKYYKDEGFIEYKIEINEEDLPEIIEDYLQATPSLTSTLMKWRSPITAR